MRAWMRSLEGLWGSQREQELHSQRNYRPGQGFLLCRLLCRKVCRKERTTTTEDHSFRRYWAMHEMTFPPSFSILFLLWPEIDLSFSLQSDSTRASFLSLRLCDINSHSLSCFGTDCCSDLTPLLKYFRCPSTRLHFHHKLQCASHSHSVGNSRTTQHPSCLSCLVVLRTQNGLVHSDLKSTAPSLSTKFSVYF